MRKAISRENVEESFGILTLKPAILLEKKFAEKLDILFAGE